MKNLYENNKVVEWDDSTGLVAFQKAKQRFWKFYHVFLARSSCQKSNDIDWNSEIDLELFI
ncbi:hypothetical protein PVK06_003538 [Gossypium arboreum]|uniref:Uncharacterized protein n=1 Tax=Gossypium arboreum TaxID=29729 RepID=A0ABR0R7S7_GOSAR|nr:hypothetical protein PVK06_003538 [Gossypium arboreum]